MIGDSRKSLQYSAVEGKQQYLLTWKVGSYCGLPLSTLQRQTAVTAYLKTGQLLLFAFDDSNRVRDAVTFDFDVSSLVLVSVVVLLSGESIIGTWTLAVDETKTAWLTCDQMHHLSHMVHW